MTELLLRAVEIIAILLPLLGVFMSVSFRIARNFDLKQGNRKLLVTQGALLTSGMFIAMGGSVASAVLTLEVAGPFRKFVYVGLYLGFLSVLIAIAALYRLLSEQDLPSPDQQTLSETLDNASDNE